MNDYPVIKFTILFAAGILIQHLFNVDIRIFYFFLITLTAYGLLLFKRILQHFPLTNQIILFVLIVLFGMSTATLNKNTTKELPGNVIHKKNTITYGKIVGINLIQKDKLIFEIQTDSIITSNIKVLSPYILKGTLKEKRGILLKFYNSIYPGYKLKITRPIYNARDKRNPGEFNYKEYLRTKGISGTINLNKINQIKITGIDKDYFKSFIFNIRKEIAKEIDKLYSSQTSALLKGLLLADRSNISYSTKEEFINAGVIHILAVSGLHVGFISLIVIILLGRINLFVRSGLTIIALFLFLFITGVPPSVVRAVIMGTVIILSFMFVRGTNLFNSLALAAFIILIIKPSQLFTPGFQLSFSAVWGIAVFYPLFTEIISKKNIKSKTIEYILLFSSVSLGAQIGTLPFTLIYFGKLSIIALAINLVVIPLVGVIIATGIVSLLLNPISSSIAIYYASANELFSGFMFWVIKITGNLGFSFIRISNLNFYDAFIIFSFLFFLLFVKKKLVNIYAGTIIIFLIIANIFLFVSLTKNDLLPENKLSVLMIDVGQGDAILIKYPDGKTSLIDAGIRNKNFDTGTYTIEPLLNHLNIDKIDLAFVSHMDIDHYGGYNYLIGKGIINELIKPTYDSTSSKDVKFEQLISKKKLIKKYYEQKIISEGNVRIYILNNTNNTYYQGLSSNNKSGIIKIVYGKTSILFTGDIESKGEKYYSKYYKDFLKSGILKVPHHGSKTSSTEHFIDYIKPMYSIISVGKYNKYHHPSVSVLSRLQRYNSKLFRTDKEGAILFQSDGIKFKKINWRD